MDHTKRTLLKELAAYGLTGTALTFAMGANKAQAGRGYDPREDIFYLNKALAREYEVIMSYDYSIQTGLFEKVAFEMFNSILTEHTRHKDMLTKAILRLGGKPIEQPSEEEFRNSFNAEVIRTGSGQHFNMRFESEAYVVLSEIATYMKDPH